MEDRVGFSDDRTCELRRRRAEIRDERRLLENSEVFPGKITAAFEAFDPGCEALMPGERSRTLRLPPESVVYDPDRNVVSLGYRPLGIKALAARSQLAREAA